MDFDKYYKNSVSSDTRRKNAKKSARSAISDRFFTYAAAAFIGLAFCFGLYYMFRLFAFLLSAVNINLDYLFAVMVYFLTFPVLWGVTTFYSSFSKTGKADFYLIFQSFFTFGAFGESLKRSLLCLVVLGLLLFPFALTAALPYIFGTSEKITVVFEVISLFLFAAGALMWLSYISGGSFKRENADFYLSFLIHFIVASITKGIYLLFLFPYICVSFIYFKEKPQ